LIIKHLLREGAGNISRFGLVFIAALLHLGPVTAIHAAEDEVRFEEETRRALEKEEFRI